jgi:aminopeptidase N
MRSGGHQCRTARLLPLALYADAVEGSGRALPRLAPIDQRGLVADQLELAQAGYQPMAGALALLAAVPGKGNPEVANEAIRRFSGLYDRFGDNAGAGKAALAARAIALWKPRLDALGFDPKAGKRCLTPTCVRRWSRCWASSVNRAWWQKRVAALPALDTDPAALDGPLKQDWLGIVSAMRRLPNGTSSNGWPRRRRPRSTGPISSCVWAR